MDFLKILRSLEELLYEVMTWLIFYPRTMVHAIRHPIQMLRYSDRELHDSTDDQYADMLSPPLFLMLTILLSHLIEVSTHQALPRATTSIGKQIVNSEENLLILRSVLFALYPLFFAVARLRGQKRPLNRNTLRAPFFAQCYVAAPASFTIGLAATMAQLHWHWVQVAGIILALVALGWYLGVEARWLQVQTHISRWRALGGVTKTWLQASFINLLLSIAVLGV